MASYYYLISSLPNLSSDSEMPITYDQFLQSCAGNVSEKNYQLLENLTVSSSEGPLLKEWAAAYGSLMNELNAQRKSRLGQSVTGSEKDGLNTQVIAAALAAANPLEAEQILLDHEFELLDTLVGMHMFDDHVLFGYAVKLKLLERRSCFEKEKGKTEFRDLFNKVQERVYSL